MPLAQQVLTGVIVAFALLGLYLLLFLTWSQRECLKQCKQFKSDNPGWGCFCR